MQPGELGGGGGGGRLARLAHRNGKEIERNNDIMLWWKIVCIKESGIVFLAQEASGIVGQFLTAMRALQGASESQSA